MRPQSLVLCIFVVLLTACSEREPATEILKTFSVKGVVVRVEDEGRTLVIDHEEMPGYMGAMTMPFRTKDVSESEGLNPGDEILFTYKVAELSSWIEAVSKTGNTKTIEVTPAKPEPSSLLKPGEAFPDFELFDEHGDLVNLAKYRGSVVALTFIFTRCPVPEYCPAMMRNFKEVETILQSDPGAPKNFKLLTVSFDGEYDSPEIMKSYGEKFGRSSGNWNLLSTPYQDQIKSLGESVGLMFGKSKNAIYSHNLRTVVLDTEGKVTKIFTDENWKPEELVKALKAAETRK